MTVFSKCSLQHSSFLEAYYQEAGHGGRDGNLCECVLFCHEVDFQTQKKIHSKNKNKELLEHIKRYATSRECRQVFLCRYFGEEVSPCGICDVCKGEHLSEFSNYIQILEEKKNKTKQKVQELKTWEEQIVLDCIKHFSGKFGKKMITSILRGSKLQTILKKKLNQSTFYGKLSHLNEVSISSKIENLLNQKIILIKGKKYPKLATVNLKAKLEKNESKTFSSEQKLFLELKSFRDKIARKYGWKKYMVLNNSVLKNIVAQRPKDLQELLQVKGIGNEKVQKYGEEILQILKKY